jgi:hypothetical protein
MNCIARGIATTMAVTVVLLGQAAAQTTSTTKPPTTTTTTTSTTTTTLLPHPFSKATSTCVRQAKAELKRCRIEGSNCVQTYNTDYAQCFAKGAGVKCATTCNTRKTTCLAGTKSARKSCNKNCVVTRRFDVRACKVTAVGDTIWAGGDAGCLTTASQNFDLCLFNCGQQRVFCENAFKFCIANCANL